MYADGFEKIVEYMADDPHFDLSEADKADGYELMAANIYCKKEDVAKNMHRAMEIRYSVITLE